MAGILPGYEKIVEQRIKEAMEKGEFETSPARESLFPSKTTATFPRTFGSRTSS